MSKFSDATFYLAPSGYKEGILFPQKPLSTNGEIAFTRASSAWRTNIEGQLEETCYNLLAYSEDFSSGYWLQQNITLTTNTTIAPDGTLTADKLIPNTTSAQHQLFGIVNFLGEGVLSFYAKADGYNFVSLGTGGGVAGGTIFFNLTNGTISGSASGLIPSIQNVGNGWYRCSLYNPTMGTGSNASYWVVARQSESISDYVGNGTSGIFIWGAQLVKGSLPRPYLSTTTRQNFPRVDYSLGTGTFLLEPQRTNVVRNSTIVGAAVGNPGTLPTNWAVFNTFSVNVSVSAIGMENGVNYIDLNFNGTASASDVIRLVFEQSTQIPASNGQTWSFSLYSKIIAQSAPPSSYQLRMTERNSSSVYVTSSSSAFIPTSTLTRFTQTYTLVGGATVSYVVPELEIPVVSGVSYNFTIRIAQPQMELGAYTTTPIFTTTSAVTRIADSFSRGNIYTNNLVSASGGTWFVSLVNNVAYTRDNASRFGIGDTTALTTNSFYFISDLTGRLLLFKSVGGTATRIYDTTTTTTKIAIKWNGSTADIFANGTKVVSATAFTATALQELIGSVGVPLFIQQMALWNTPLTDAQCTDLTL